VRREILGAAGLGQCEGLADRIQQTLDASGLTIFQPELDIERAALDRADDDEARWKSLLEGVRRAFESDGRPLPVAEVDALLAS
jgi:hypothetical protein